MQTSETKENAITTAYLILINGFIDKEKIMRKLFSILFALVAVVMLSSCRFVSPDADEETVLVKKPWIFGHGGVDDTPVQSGLTWCALSTRAETFKIVPVRHEVLLDDIFSDDNTPLDFHSVIVTQVE